jgi:hypothetical protein
MQKDEARAVEMYENKFLTMQIYQSEKEDDSADSEISSESTSTRSGIE